MSGRIGVGIDSFSYHRWFGETTRWETPLGTRWRTGDFLRRAASLGVCEVALQTVYLPDQTGPGLAELRSELQVLGLRPTLCWGHPDGLKGGESGERVESLRNALSAAKALGCSLVRLVCGNQFSNMVPAAERIARLTPILRDVAAAAAELDLMLAVENHADFVMRDLVRLVDAVASDRLGICFDTGNAVRLGDDLLDAVALAAPYVRMVHLKDMIVQPASRGDPTAWWPSVPVGRGEFDLPAFVDALRNAGFAGTLFVEMANMHPDWPDEDAAVAESVAWLRRCLDAE